MELSKTSFLTHKNLTQNSLLKDNSTTLRRSLSSPQLYFCPNSENPLNNEKKTTPSMTYVMNSFLLADNHLLRSENTKLTKVLNKLSHELSEYRNLLTALQTALSKTEESFFELDELK